MQEYESYTSCRQPVFASAWTISDRLLELERSAKLPVDKLKIDRSFVRDLGHLDDSITIVRGITSLATSIGVATTAEGVETLNQLEALREAGCTEVQGFLISKPLPARDMSRLLSGLKGRERRNV